MIAHCYTILLLFAHYLMGMAYSLFLPDSPSYYFTTRPNLLTFARPISMADESLLLFAEPDEKSLPDSALVRSPEERLQQQWSYSNAYSESTPAQKNSRNSPTTTKTTIQRFFGSPWWMPKKNRAAQKLGASLNEPATQRDKRVHALSLLRAYDGSTNVLRPPGMYTNDKRFERATEAPRAKRVLHSLSILRGYDAKSNFLRPGIYTSDNHFGHATERGKRLHSLSLLRGYDGSSNILTPGIYADNDRIERATPLAKRSLHGLSILRGYDGSSIFLRPDAYNSGQATPRGKRVHALSMLRGYDTNSNYLRPNIYANDNNRIEQATPREKRVHSLSILRGYYLRSPYEANNLQRMIRRSKKSIHGLALLRGYNKLSVGPLRDDATSIQRHYKEEVERKRLATTNNNNKSKRVHSLSLLRYDGKLFQNGLLSTEFQQKRFSPSRNII